MIFFFFVSASPHAGRHREAAKAHLAFVDSADDDIAIRTLAVVRQKAGACYAMAGDLERAEEQWAVVSQARATVPLPFFLFFLAN